MYFIQCEFSNISYVLVTVTLSPKNKFTPVIRCNLLYCVSGKYQFTPPNIHLAISSHFIKQLLQIFEISPQVKALNIGFVIELTGVSVSRVRNLNRFVYTSTSSLIFRIIATTRNLSHFYR